MDRETAIEFTERIEAAFVLMGGVSGFLKTRLDQADFNEVMDKWGEIILELDLGVLEVIYRAHPDLRPEGMTPVARLGVGSGWRGPKQTDGAEPDEDANN